MPLNWQLPADRATDAPKKEYLRCLISQSPSTCTCHFQTQYYIKWNLLKLWSTNSEKKPMSCVLSLGIWQYWLEIWVLSVTNPRGYRDQLEQRMSVGTSKDTGGLSTLKHNQLDFTNTNTQIQIHKYTNTHTCIWGQIRTRECCLNSSTMYNAKYTLMHNTYIYWLFISLFSDPCWQCTIHSVNILTVYITFFDLCWQCLIMSEYSRVMLGDVLYRGGRRLGSVDGSLDNYLFAGAMIPGKHIPVVPNNLWPYQAVLFGLVQINSNSTDM